MDAKQRMHALPRINEALLSPQFTRKVESSEGEAAHVRSGADLSSTAEAVKKAAFLGVMTLADPPFITGKLWLVERLIIWLQVRC